MLLRPLATGSNQIRHPSFVCVVIVALLVAAIGSALSLWTCGMPPSSGASPAKRPSGAQAPKQQAKAKVAKSPPRLRRVRDPNRRRLRQRRNLVRNVASDRLRRQRPRLLLLLRLTRPSIRLLPYLSGHRLHRSLDGSDVVPSRIVAVHRRPSSRPSVPLRLPRRVGAGVLGVQPLLRLRLQHPCPCPPLRPKSLSRSGLRNPRLSLRLAPRFLRSPRSRSLRFLPLSRYLGPRRARLCPRGV